MHDSENDSFGSFLQFNLECQSEHIQPTYLEILLAILTSTVYTQAFEIGSNFHF